MKIKVAFCASEVFPFAKTGGLADVCGALPKALQRAGVEVLVFVPYYRCVKKGGFKLEQAGEHSLKGQLALGIDVIFIKNDLLFDREGLYGDERGDYPDNLARFQYFSQEVLRFLKNSGQKVDILHCHDWQTALIPVYLKEQYGEDGFFRGTRSLLTVHNLAFQGIFPKEQFQILKLPRELYGINGFEFYDKINLLKAGIIFSGQVNTVSPQYAKEIKTEKGGCGLHDILKARVTKLKGILNGLDYEIWDPAKDKLLIERYSRDDFKHGKARNKQELLKQLMLPESGGPLIGNVGRISHQKGFEVILAAMDELADIDCQFVFQGLGDEAYIDQLRDHARRHPGKLSVRPEFNERLAHQIYAGSDFFLMPSEFEPCGLSQLISFRYGTIPIVHKTGGLADTVKDERTGITFEPLSAEKMVKAIKKAVRIYGDKKKFGKLVVSAMDADFSWERPANEYKDIYGCLLSG